MQRVYLDYNATTPLDPAVFEAMVPWLRGNFGNPSSLHGEGRAARRAVEDARDEVEALIGADPGEVTFTSGATEANGWAVFAAGERATPGPPRIVVSSIEHPSILEPAAELERRGAAVLRLPVDAAGRVIEDALDEGFLRGVDLVAVMAANNEVGTVQPWRAIAERCAAFGVRFHIDAVQAVVKSDFEVRNLGPGTASLSAHKLGGPKGIGALWIRRESRLAPLLTGGGQERGRRAGTENVAAIVGFGAAARRAREHGARWRRALEAAEAQFLAALERERVPFVLQGPKAASDRLPGTLSLRIPGLLGETLMIALDLRGVAVSLGSACSSGAARPSHVLTAMGKTKVENLETIRISLGWDHSAAELELAARSLAEVVIPKSQR